MKWNSETYAQFPNCQKSSLHTGTASSAGKVHPYNNHLHKLKKWSVVIGVFGREAAQDMW